MDKFLYATQGSPRIVVIQIDTAECEEKGYDVTRPNKDKDLEKYSLDLRNLVVEKIQTWLGVDFNENVAHAVAIEETEAWVLALLDSQLKKDSASFSDPKVKFKNTVSSLVSRKSLTTYRTAKNELSASEYISGAFTKKKPRREAMKRNKSLELFIDELSKYITA